MEGLTANFGMNIKQAKEINKKMRIWYKKRSSTARSPGSKASYGFATCQITPKLVYKKKN